MLALRIIPALALLLLSACSVQPLRQSDLASSYIQTKGRLAECAELFDRTDKLVLEAGVMDAQAARLPGFPYLRSNRFSASFRHELEGSTERLGWLQQMRKLDRQARHYELQNVTTLNTEYDDEYGLRVKLDACAEIMMQADLQDPTRLEQIKQAAMVADSYINGNRILGIYPLSSLFVKSGVRRVHNKIKRTFAEAAKALVNGGILKTYAPKEAGEAEVRHILQHASANALSMPVFSEEDKDSLFRYFAPVWEVNGLDNDNSIGSPSWSGDEKLNINTSDAVVYQHLSYTRFSGQVLAQFNYIIWFPARPASAGFDILAGHLDGITWRVSVDSNGKVLMYDAMHNCGCYHMFFPAGDTRIRDAVSTEGEEPILVPQRAPVLQAGQRLHLRIAAGSHYIEAVQAKSIAAEHTSYRFANYNELRSIAVKEGKRLSMFGVNGIVAGTSRKERWLLWPMGVADAGAMRQWGHHAIAFVGRRHFDDAHLLDRYFSLP